MKQTASIISTYAADVSGVCSALYELGGMTVMHDASGCNSTYNTHDEPRWYDIDSMVYISALTEMDALMGNDSKLIDDITDTASYLSPAFIAIAGSPIPMVTGFDFTAVASVIEKRTGIPTFGFNTNGMHSYISGASKALEAIVKRFCRDGPRKSSHLAANIIGLTPLDFSVNGSDKSIKNLIMQNGYNVISTISMGTSLEEISHASEADINFVVSSCGLTTAQYLQNKFGIPYIAGIPYGPKLTEQYFSAASSAIKAGVSDTIYSPSGRKESKISIIGENITSSSLAAALENECGLPCKVIVPIDTSPSLLRDCDNNLFFEDEIKESVDDAEIIIADPLFRPICPSSSRFIALPHEAFSGRIYRKDIPDLIKNFNIIKKEVK
jgi:nitrogenase molybdenum-cofactor synthesis protein NifE